MSIDELPAQFDVFLERARAVLEREITAAKNIVAAANAEKSSAQNALSDLQGQLKQAQGQLDAVMKDLQRGSTLAGLNREITGARKTLEKLQAETAEATKSLEALNKQRAEADTRLVALNLEANRMIAIRVEGETVMANLRAQLQQVSSTLPRSIRRRRWRLCLSWMAWSRARVGNLERVMKHREADRRSPFAKPSPALPDLRFAPHPELFNAIRLP